MPVATKIIMATAISKSKQIKKAIVLIKTVIRRMIVGHMVIPVGLKKYRKISCLNISMRDTDKVSGVLAKLIQNGQPYRGKHKYWYTH